MAFSSTTAWDVRTTGDDSNGGGFDTASAGTDYSQQDSQQVTYTDLAIDASDNTKITSSAHAFTSAHVGNVINITSGTGFTVQRVQVVSVSSGVATCDKAVGTTSSTGGHGKLGGGLQTIAAALALGVDGNPIYIKSGTYTLTARQTLTTQVSLIGYHSAHGDLNNASWSSISSNAPLITTSTDSVSPMFLASTGNGLSGYTSIFQNLHLTNTASVRAEGPTSGTHSANICVDSCIIDGFTKGVDCDNGTYYDAILLIVKNCEIKNCTVYAINQNANALVIADCYIHDNSDSNGYAVSANGSTAVIERTILYNNIGNALNSSGGFIAVRDCAFSTADENGLNLGASNFLLCENCIFYGGGLYGITSGGSRMAYASVNNCAFGSNGSGAVNVGTSLPGEKNSLSLSASPFTSSTNFLLNSTSGGGALLKGAGVPSAFPGGTTTGVPDVGPVQSSGGGGGGSPSGPTTYIA